MKLIGAALGNQIHYPAEHPSVLRFVIVRLDLKFLNGVDYRQNRVTAVENVRVQDAIQVVEVRSVPLAVDRRAERRAAGYCHSAQRVLLGSPEPWEVCTGVAPGVRVSSCVKFRPFSGRSPTALLLITVPNSVLEVW